MSTTHGNTHHARRAQHHGNLHGEPLKLSLDTADFRDRNQSFQTRVLARRRLPWGLPLVSQGLFSVKDQLRDKKQDIPQVGEMTQGPARTAPNWIISAEKPE